MKSEQTRLDFIRLRAEGRSYRAIAAALGIGRSTCGIWERELEADIAALKRDKLEELFTSYGLTKQARIERLGKTLTNIEAALNAADLEAMPPEKLLDFKLKYAAALREEYTGTESRAALKKPLDADGLIEALQDLLARIQAGELTTEQAARETALLSSILKAYEAKKLQAKIETLETILESK